MSTALIEHPAIDIRGATLPARYEAAKSAIATCDRIDECQDWADKAAALASYAKQANDDELIRIATRIQLRAVRRCGELLKEIAPRDTSAGRPVNGKGDLTISRKQAAADAGMSLHQKREALRVAAVPEEEFELRVESERPTVTEMAERGTRKSLVVDLLDGRDPEDFKAATAIRGWLIPLSDLTLSIAPEVVARGSRPREVPGLLMRISTLEPWLTALRVTLQKEYPDAGAERTAR